MLRSINPYSGKELSTYTEHSTEEVDTLVNKVYDGFYSWRQVAGSSKSALFLRLSEQLLKDKNSWAKLITLEMGKPVGQAVAEIEKCALLCSYYAEHAEEFLAVECIPTDFQISEVHYHPLGVILGIMPWNFPFWQVFRFMVPALMAGNTILLKHASNVTGCAMAISEIFHKAGLPENAFGLLLVSSTKMGEVIDKKQIAGVSFTGSTSAGKHIASSFGRGLKPGVLELGGSNAFVVLDGANVAEAVEAAVWSRFQNNGQSCIASKRFFIEATVYDEFIGLFSKAVKDLVVGDPLDEGCFIGPLAREELASNLHDQVERSLAKGAKLLVGGRKQGAMYAPTILSEVKPGMAVFEEETFGPVAAVCRVSGLEEALMLSNESKYGLGITVFTGNAERVVDKASEVDDGALFVNTVVASDPRLPFGGTKESGYGRELGRDGILAFVNRKTVVVK